MITDNELITRSLNMYANWLETGDVVLSKQDAINCNKKTKDLNQDQLTLVSRLRSLKQKLDSPENRRSSFQDQQDEKEFKRLNDKIIDMNKDIDDLTFAIKVNEQQSSDKFKWASRIRKRWIGLP